ncbi:hypothetical protein NDU88_007609 [Pleurodeles waltl]|uniref:Ribosomal protein n=1 Tax=Pleurodeles waltl TaxID=8319 RepID=A0AAV7VU04_PLEWA|nr:hypothetical protein NDU88_007609 [Pleurodeles waltl]
MQNRPIRSLVDSFTNAGSVVSAYKRVRGREEAHILYVGAEQTISVQFSGRIREKKSSTLLGRGAKTMASVLLKKAVVAFMSPMSLLRRGAAVPPSFALFSFHHLSAIPVKANQSMATCLRLPLPSHQFLASSLLPVVYPTAGMKVKSAIKKRCKDCFIVRRGGQLHVICKTHPRHKQPLSSCICSFPLCNMIYSSFLENYLELIPTLVEGSWRLKKEAEATVLYSFGPFSPFGLAWHGLAQYCRLLEKKKV